MSAHIIYSTNYLQKIVLKKNHSLPHFYLVYIKEKVCFFYYFVYDKKLIIIDIDAHSVDNLQYLCKEKEKNLLETLMKTRP